MLNKLQLVTGLCLTGIVVTMKSAEAIPSLSGVELPATTVEEVVSQAATQQTVIIINEVRANPTESGVEVILQTPQGEQLQITNRSAENNFIADIPNAQLLLPSGDGFTFTSQNPVEGITEISVFNLDNNTIRVTVTGAASVPVVELFDSPEEGLIFVLTPATTAIQPEVEQPMTNEIPPEERVTQQDDSIELIVTGQQDTGYHVPNTSVGTRTDTPLRDIPQSIQVIPQEVLRDQQAGNPLEALRNVPGVSKGSFSRSYDYNFNIRGFPSRGNVLINGLRDTSSIITGFNVTNIERVEVLKEPASVLYGQGLLGGAVNYVTKQPLSEPYAFVEASAGSFNFYRGALDLSGPLNDSKTVLYRLNVAASTTESFVDFFQDQQYFVAPVLTWQISDRTKLTLDAEYVARFKDGTQQGLPVEGTILPNPNGRIPRNRFLGEPDIGEDSVFAIRAGYNLEHQFSENWQIRNALRFSRNESVRTAITNVRLAADNRTMERRFFTVDDNAPQQEFRADTYLVGEFSTGSIRHQLVAGFDLARQESSFLTILREALLDFTTLLDLEAWLAHK